VTDEDALRNIFCHDFVGQYNGGQCDFIPSRLFGDRKFIYGPSNAFTDELVKNFRKDLNIYPWGEELKFLNSSISFDMLR